MWNRGREKVLKDQRCVNSAVVVDLSLFKPLRSQWLHLSQTAWTDLCQQLKSTVIHNESYQAPFLTRVVILMLLKSIFQHIAYFKNFRTLC